MPIEISIDELPEAWIMNISGDLDYGECARFRISIDRILREMPPAVVVDLSGIEFMDSSGLGLLLSLSREYGEADGRLVLVSSETVDGVLDITHLTGVFTHEPDAKTALEHLKQAEPPGSGGSA